MLKQKVNLIHSVDRIHSNVFLPWEKFIQIQKIFLIVLLVLSLFSSMKTFNVYLQWRSESVSTHATENRYEKMKSHFPDLSKTSNLTQSIQDIEMQIKEKRRKLSNMTSPYQWDFSDGLLLLSQSSNAFMWIDSFELNFQKNESEVNGYAVSLEGINDFSKQLTHNPLNQKNIVNISSVSKIKSDRGEPMYQFSIQLTGNI